MGIALHVKNLTWSRSFCAISHFFSLGFLKHLLGTQPWPAWGRGQGWALSSPDHGLEEAGQLVSFCPELEL